MVLKVSSDTLATGKGDEVDAADFVEIDRLEGPPGRDPAPFAYFPELTES